MLFFSDCTRLYTPSGPVSQLNAVYRCGLGFRLFDFANNTDQILLLCNTFEGDLEFDDGGYLGIGEFSLLHGRSRVLAEDKAPQFNDAVWHSAAHAESMSGNSALLFAMSSAFFNEMLSFLSIDMDFSELMEFEAFLMDSDMLELVMGASAHIAVYPRERTRDRLTIDRWYSSLEDYAMELFHHYLRFLLIKQRAVDAGIGKRDQTRRDVIHALLKAKGYIERNYMEKIDSRSISAFAGISHYHFHRLFKQIFAATPGQYLTRYRLNEARKMIRYHDARVTDAALEVGYDSLSSFIHAFELQFGYSPKNSNKPLPPKS